VILGYNDRCDIASIREKHPNKKIIIYQLEQLYNSQSEWYNLNSDEQYVINRTNHIRKQLSECDEIWDYDENNIEFLYNEGFKNIKHFPMVYCEKLKQKNNITKPKYDILFFGSINDKRLRILKLLHKKYNILIISPNSDTYKSIFNDNIIDAIHNDKIYEHIFDSKIIVNLHYYESNIQEQVRLFELLINNCVVVSEKSKTNYFNDLIIEFDGDDDMFNKIDLALDNYNVNRNISDKFKKDYLIYHDNYDEITKSKYFLIKPDNLIKSEHINPDIAVILHLYYTDLLPEFLSYLKNIKQPYDLYISIVNTENNLHKVVDDIIKFKNDANILLVDNKGLDIGGTFMIMKKILHDNKSYKYYLKLQTKKSLHTPGNFGENWRKELCRICDSELNVHNSLNLLKLNNVGMVGNKTNICDSNGLFTNTHIVNQYAKKFKLNLDNLEFIAGTMFWVKGEIWENFFKMINIDLEYSKFCNGSFNDFHEGRYTHSMERIFGVIVKSNKLKIIGIENETSKNQKLKILCVTHDESISGAPRVMHDIILKLKSDNIFDISVLSLTISNDKWNFVDFRMSDDDFNLNKLKKLKPDLIFCNTIVSTTVLNLFDCNKLIYIHENKTLNLIFKPLLNNIQQNDTVIVATDKSIPYISKFSHHVEKMPTYLHYDKVIITDNKIEDFILCIGKVEDRKGLDRFLEVAKNTPEKQFIWIGDTKEVYIENNTIKYLKYYSFRDNNNNTTEHVCLEIPNNVKFIGLISNHDIMNYWLPKSTAVLMLSYDDPYPLIVIESKLLNKNVVVIENCGSSHEICDSSDLILSEYNLSTIVDWLKNLIPNIPIFNDRLSDRLENNFNLINNKILECILEKNKKL
jgi:glycosyltransferase involved in cell wall biosynthesis